MFSVEDLDETGKLTLSVSMKLMMVKPNRTMTNLFLWLTAASILHHDQKAHFANWIKNIFKSYLLSLNSGPLHRLFPPPECSSCLYPCLPFPRSGLSLEIPFPGRSET